MATRTIWRYTASPRLIFSGSDLRQPVFLAVLPERPQMGPVLQPAWPVQPEERVPGRRVIRVRL